MMATLDQPFHKPSAGNSLLHAASSHPASLKASLPYGQYLRLKRNCCEDGHFEKEAKALQLRLKQCRYSSTCLKKAYIRAKNLNKASLIHDPKSVKSNPGVRTITRISGQHRQVRDIM